ncbi:MAG: HD domain-containing protein [Desulfuromonadia bacterium]
MMSLKAKVLGVTTLIVICVVTLFTVVNLGMEKSIINEIVAHDSQLLTETIRNSISNSMRHGRSDEVGSILSHIRSEPTIRSVRIVDDSGRILNSANPSEVDGSVNSTVASALDPSKPFSFSPADQNGTYIVLARIPNAPACHGCHSPLKKTLGILQVGLSMSNLQAFHSTLKRNSFYSTVILITLLIALFSYLLTRYVDRPLKTLATAMQRLEGGDFDCPVTITSSREMNQFAEHFNTMLHRLHHSIDRSLEQERQLVKSQEQLAHARQIEEMNSRLESQLVEIEELNNTLRKKVEELEEANYKISDLASELEDKNNILESTISRLSTLYRIALGISSTMEMESLYTLILRNTMETVRAEIGYILFRGPASDQVTIKHLAGIPAPHRRDEPMSLDSFRISRTVMESGRALLYNRDDRGMAALVDSPLSPLGFHRTSLLCVPLRIHHETIGTIVLANKGGGAFFDSDDLDLVSTIASQASIAIKNAILYDDLQQAYFTTIQALVSAIEASDSYTRGHSERVTQYALALARRTNQPVERLKILERAAVLHDIGKIGIDLSLLHKSGHLTPSDIEQLRQHPVIGMKILDPITFLNDVKICILQHHERYDGTGYPNALSQDQLLLESRILAIADAYDAMTSDRPYRKALSVEVALRELEQHAGTQFDPDLVPIFTEMIRSASRPGTIFSTGQDSPQTVDSPSPC